MEWSTGELMFYGGIGVMIVSVLAGILLFRIARITSSKLNTRLNMEYGKKIKCLTAKMPENHNGHRT